MTEFQLSWMSTPHERYETDMEARALRALTDAGVQVTGTAGGTSYEEDPVSDNSIFIEANSPHYAALLIAAATGHTVHVVHPAPEC